MYNRHPSFKEPEEKNVKIWRYMNFYKFISILEYNSLFFSSVKSLGKFDKMEGFLSKDAFNYLLKNSPKRMQEGLPDAMKKARELIYVNCWHINKLESDAMWKIYVGNDAGLAIQSTFNRLKNSLSNFEKEIYIGKVKYIKPDDIVNRKIVTVPFTAFDLVMHKRKSFEHEQELRATILLPKAKKTGVRINVNLDELIEVVYVAPQCKSWIKELIEKVLVRFKLDKKVNYSSLQDEPPY